MRRVRIKRTHYIPKQRGRALGIIKEAIAQTIITKKQKACREKWQTTYGFNLSFLVRWGNRNHKVS
jgi:hypothetical protein